MSRVTALVTTTVTMDLVLAPWTTLASVTSVMTQERDNMTVVMLCDTGPHVCHVLSHMCQVTADSATRSFLTTR